MLEELAKMNPRQRREAGESMMEERLNSLPSPNDLPDVTVTTTVLALAVMAQMGKYESPRDMYVRWGTELSQQEMCEIWKEVDGWTTPQVLAIYNDPRLDLERQAYRFEQIKNSTLPNYADPQYRKEAIKRQIANIQERLDLIGSRWREATESYVAYGAPGVRVASNSSLARLGRMEVDYINLWQKLMEELEALEERQSGGKDISDYAMNAAARKLSAWKQQQQQPQNLNITVINNPMQDNRTQIIQQTSGQSQNPELPNGNPRSLPPAPQTPLTSPIITSE